MSKNLPEISITFSKLAVSAVSRSEKGIVCLLVNDSGANIQGVNKYAYLSDVNESDYNAVNYQAIKDCFMATPNMVYVVAIGAEAQFSAATQMLDAIGFNWLAYINQTEQSDVVTYIKSRNAKTAFRKVKAVVWNNATADDMHIVNFTNTAVKRVDEEATTEGYKYLGRLVGMFAALPFTRSATYYKLPDLESVTEPAEAEGTFFIINNYGEPMTSRAINSLKTLTGGISPDFQKVTIVEAMDMILEDIYTTFKNQYVGKYKNKLDYQKLFIAAVNGYFRQLAKEDVLDNQYDNTASIDTAAQRDAWVASGKEEAAAWDDAKTEKMTYQSYIFLKGDIKILDAIEDLAFPITLA